MNITIDSEETPDLLTHEGKEVKCSAVQHSWNRDDPDDDKIFTLCKEQCKSGRHYWEVKVKESHPDKLSWFVGVASEAAERKFNFPFTPQNEFWVLSYEKEIGFYTRDQAELSVLQDVDKELTAVGVFLDCDKHTLTFYNINTQSHIYTFTEVKPKTSLRPLISPGIRDPYPLHII